MKKLLLSIPDPAYKWLQKEANRFGIPVTEFLRRVIDEMRDRAEEDEQLKKELLVLARSGAARPKKGTRLGDALIAFTTPPRKGK